MKHKTKSLEKRPKSPQYKHEVIYVIAGGFTSGGSSNNAQKRYARKLLTIDHGGRN